MNTKSTTTYSSWRMLANVLSIVVILAIALANTGFAVQASEPASTFVVNTTDDSDDGVCDDTHCSLREAIYAANENPGADKIAFNIGEPPFTIQLQSSLPNIDDPVTIDGTTQLGFSRDPIIELDGTNAGEGISGLAIFAGNSTVRGLLITSISGS